VSRWEALVESGALAAGVDVTPFTTYKLGGPADFLAEVRSRDQLGLISGAYQSEPLPVLVLGRGSNLVISDQGFRGLVIRLLGPLAEIEVAGSVAAGGGASLPLLARTAVKAGRLGLEFMVGIPGSVGGAVRQNAGCFGQEMVDVLERAEIFDLAGGEGVTVGSERLDLGYRHSAVTPTQLVVRAWFRTRSGDPREGEDRMREITRWRRQHQPGGTLNAGSVFKNPPGDTAGRLIDSLGLKGMAVGGASVSHKHANFFEAAPGTRASDVHRLVAAVARRVREASGVVLEPEVQFVGSFDGEADG
jgi:UDP-N-acetylmuramate dehydrogenase